MTIKSSGLSLRFFISFGVNVFVLLCAVLLGVFTYAVMTGDIPFIRPTPQNMRGLLYLDIVVLVFLGLLVAQRIVSVWREHRKGIAGSELHLRFIVLFAALSVTPALIISTFSVLFFNLGLESWFSGKVRTALEQSQSIAEGYLRQTQQSLQVAAVRISNALSQNAPLFMANRAFMVEELSLQARINAVQAALIFSPGEGTVARVGFSSFAMDFETVSQKALLRAHRGESVLLLSLKKDNVRVLIQPHRFSVENLYLLIEHTIDPKILTPIKDTERAVAQFKNTEKGRHLVQTPFILAFFAVAVLLLLAAVWVGFHVASTLSRPLGALITATHKVRDGDFSFRIPHESSNNDFQNLNFSFNRMTQQLHQQRQKLLKATREVDDKRLFTEAVLKGVSSGVFGVDRKGVITLFNAAASQLLGREDLLGHTLTDLFPELAPLWTKVQLSGYEHLEHQVILGKHINTFSTHIVLARDRHAEWSGCVVTFDDITRLIEAQKKAAWSDVARRIAHEIKNPLTPLQIAAERLKKRIHIENTAHRTLFEGCTDTILMQVAHIEHLVNEFSDFARMPPPIMAEEELTQLCQKTYFLYSCMRKDIHYTLKVPGHGMILCCDGQQISQVISNLLRNATEAVGEGGRVTLGVEAHQASLCLYVDDDGPGWSLMSSSPTDPYVTTKKGGTGLGLSIVKRIVEDHGGRLLLKVSPWGGARAEVLFPLGRMLFRSKDVEDG